MMRRIKITTILLLVLVSLTASALADDLVMFNYQGRVKVTGNTFNGTGYFKFAILTHPGDATLWSSDGTSANGSEPTGFIPITVSDGIFNVMVGDPDLGMVPMSRIIFNHPSHLVLRIWFSDGTHGFQQLHPDKRIANPTLIGILSDKTDYTIYVDGTTGNDDNDGLTSPTAKKTIQAAVDILTDRMKNNVTIELAAGVYRERALVVGIMGNGGKLTIIGDKTWTPASPGDPNVRITGSNDDLTAVRDCSINVTKSHGVYLKGLFFDRTTYSGLIVVNSRVVVTNCKSSNNGMRGAVLQDNANVDLFTCLFTNNTEAGCYIANASWGLFNNCKSTNNPGYGIVINGNSFANFLTAGEYSNNGNNGIHAIYNSFVIFNQPVNIKNNTGYGLSLGWQSFSDLHSTCTITGNTLGSVSLNYGSATYR